MPNKKFKKPLEIKISTIPAVSVILHETELNALRAELKEITGNAEDYFDNDLAIIDLAELDCEAQKMDWPEFLATLRSFRLHPAAVRGAPALMNAELQSHGLSLDITARPQPATKTTEETAPSVETVAPTSSVASNKSMIVDTPVRTGQRIYARDADLVIMAAVNSGAEIIADGSIHVYAPLRGRALAGARGDTSARIFTLSLEAELVSIAGIYNTFENGFPVASRGKPMQLQLIDDRIKISAVNTDGR